MLVIVGLGNPGKEYSATRHNLGFRVVQELAARLQIKSFKHKHQALLAEGQLAGHKLILVQPQTYMNESGLAVQAILSWHKATPRELVVIYDDVDLEPGQVRVREKGSAGGHHGMESIIGQLGTTEFARVRIGIGRENVTGDVSDYVLQNIPPGQSEALDEAVQTAAAAVESIITAGLPAAMNKFNS